MSKSFRRYITAQKRTSKHKPRQHRIEHLESRINPSSVIFSSGVLTVTGDALSNDTITIEDVDTDGDIDVTINGVDFLDAAPVAGTRLDVFGLSGSDSI